MSFLIRSSQAPLTLARIFVTPVRSHARTLLQPQHYYAEIYGYVKIIQESSLLVALKEKVPRLRY
jgi:hypothetical protein